ncbi:RagB/SusD family nutrient uptake outer membrane protein [Ginsengibacter hankyongi]|uniref:RagB/SusD family nutrient uptake outer membrane protein n=1 Tax=Ginsengibacter hankyongi TaxID=2607284 RepID=A0A5J5IJX2_9BACT|nr:RagB/SusD family nutrient uptake outer membrane protein [Ginsengibacter hankyongi]KAA9040828.1 RagB/SusD family nutrient uptake outer membrane protein [Ginsengibacter hankyongi]
MNEFATPSFGEASCDNYFEPIDIYSSGDDGSKATYTWQPHDYIAPNDWSSAYLPVYNSNYCLETLDNIPMSASNEATWKNVKGSALFFRAYYFGQLAWVYAKAYDKSTASTDLGIALRLTSDFNVTSTRATVEETYKKIVADTKESVMYLPELPVHSYRPSKAAAYGLLARTYLSMRQYDSAFKYADLCLALQNSLLNYNDGSINATSFVPFQRFNKEIIFYTSMNGLNITPLYSRADTTLYDSYSDSDRRKQM